MKLSVNKVFSLLRYKKYQDRMNRSLPLINQKEKNQKLSIFQEPETSIKTLKDQRPKTKKSEKKGGGGKDIDVH